MNLVLTIKNQKDLILSLERGDVVVDRENLTISQNLDSMLIRSIDKLLLRNRIDRLSLKDLKIAGKTRPEAVSTMVIGAVMSAMGA